MKSEDAQLEARIQELEALRDQRDYFIEETEKYAEKVEEIYDLFPENVMAEDAIRESMDVEDGSNSEMFSIMYSSAEAVYNPIATSVEGMKAAGASASSSGNAEGESAEGESAEGAEAQEQTPEEKAESDEQEGFNLMQQPVQYGFVCDLNQFERAALTINRRGERDVITNVALVYDESTGMLTGQMDINKFYVTGRGLDYEPASFNVPTGSRNLFSTLTRSSELSENEMSSGSESEGRGAGSSAGGATAAPE
jgi:hypothetical protein